MAPMNRQPNTIPGQGLNQPGGWHTHWGKTHLQPLHRECLRRREAAPGERGAEVGGAAGPQLRV